MLTDPLQKNDFLKALQILEISKSSANPWTIYKLIPHK